HNEIQIYTWDDAECCLPKGATRAALLDEWLAAEAPQEQKGYGKKGYGKHDDCEPDAPPPPRKRKLDLKAGDFLLFEEVRDPKTGNTADANPSHRHVVRLTRVEASVDELHDLPILEIEWAHEDALPFPLCLSAIGGKDCRLVKPVSVARGNILLVDHGRWVEEDLDEVPPGESAVRCEGEGRVSEAPQTAGKFKFHLKRAPVTLRQPIPAGEWIAASRLLSQDPRRAVPQVGLGGNWSVRRDLLGSGPGDFHFVAEVDDDGRAHLRFGNGETGFAPLAGTAFDARYRVGNGRAGNVGAEAIRHLALGKNQSLSGLSLKPRNPLPARGGTDPEPLAEVRLLAPHAFRKDLQRAITAEDYAHLVERDFEGRVQKAAAVLRWTGGWPEVLVAVDPLSGEEDVDRLLSEIEGALHRYRRIGHDIVVSRAVSVPLHIELFLCVRSSFVRGHVKAAVMDALRVFFHPDKLSFRQGIALSRLTATAQAVTGVESVKVEKFQRHLEDPEGEIENGFLPLGPLEIARLGEIKLTMGGGR
ncbi:MAG TPA: putative baseplate assembly protein, partial [Thermoanaerobaculia bacterium]|nr:putative baseplate assembly protein [Thermoanaerobaculia bacterium]